MLSLSAFAGTLKLKTIENAVDYENVTMSYDVSHGPMIVLEANRNNGIPRHPETWVDIFTVNKSNISFVRGNFIVTIDGVATICAKLNGDVLVETGACSLVTQLDSVSDSLVVSLVTK